MISRRLLLGAAAPLAAASIIRSAMAFPDRPMRMIVPFAAGGHTDLLARRLEIRLHVMPRLLPQIFEVRALVSFL